MDCCCNVLIPSDGTCKPTSIEDLTRTPKHPTEGLVWDCTAVEGDLRDSATCRLSQDSATCRASKCANFWVIWSVWCSYNFGCRVDHKIVPQGAH